MELTILCHNSKFEISIEYAYIIFYQGSQFMNNIILLQNYTKLNILDTLYIRCYN